MTAGSGRRIGVFGGTFDPVHVGHLVAAVNVRHALSLDTVLLVVANEPWQKAGEGRRLTPAADRYAMVEAAVEGVEGLEASRMELDRGGPSYSADTLAQLSRESPGAELFLVIGSDLVPELGAWERVEEIRDLAKLVVVTRAGAPAMASGGWAAVGVDIPDLHISSTDLRERAADRRPLDFLVPEPAIRVIHDRALYAGAR